MTPDDERTRQSYFKAFATYTGLGVQLGIMLFVGLKGGDWLDHHFATEPLFFMIGVFVSITGWFYQLYKTVKSL